MARGGSDAAGIDGLDGLLDQPMRATQMHGYRAVSYDPVTYEDIEQRVASAVTLDEVSAQLANDDGNDAGGRVWLRFGKQWHLARQTPNVNVIMCGSSAKALRADPDEVSAHVRADMRVCYKCLILYSGHVCHDQASSRGGGMVKGMGSVYGRDLRCGCGWGVSTNEGGQDALRWVREQHMGHMIRCLQLDNVSDADRPEYQQQREDLAKNPERAEFVLSLKVGDAVALGSSYSKQDGQLARVTRVGHGDIPYHTEWVNVRTRYDGELEENIIKDRYNWAGQPSDSRVGSRNSLQDPAEFPEAAAIKGDL